jgi:hypothetical protein
VTDEPIPDEWKYEIDKIKAADIEVARLSTYHFRCEGYVDFWPSSRKVYVPMITKNYIGAIFTNSLCGQKGIGAQDVIRFGKEIQEEEDWFYRTMDGVKA